MPIRIVRGKECDINGIFSCYLLPHSILKCSNHAAEFIKNNHLKYWMDCFSLKRVDSGVRNDFYWHDCECGLPTIICRTSVFLEHRDINNDQKQVDIDFFEFFEQAESYI